MESHDTERRRQIALKALSERLHMPNAAFALGDDVVVAIANQILAMPLLILMARLCPAGAEGSTYALVTSIQMVGGTVGGILSQIATGALDVTNTDFQHLWLLTVLTCAARVASLILLPLVPRTAAVVEVAEDSARSPIAGGVVIGFFVGGFVWALVQIARAMA